MPNAILIFITNHQYHFHKESKLLTFAKQLQSNSLGL
jgi:hypothetical protein